MPPDLIYSNSTGTCKVELHPGLPPKMTFSYMQISWSTTNPNLQATLATEVRLSTQAHISEAAKEKWFKDFLFATMNFPNSPRSEPEVVKRFLRNQANPLQGKPSK
jgi:hypothetical protein